MSETYELKAPILGFEYIKHIELEKIDDFFAKAVDREHDISFMLINPYNLREYSFTIPKYIELLLDLNKDSALLVYCIMVLKKDIEESTINFLAPLIFNKDLKLAAQIALSMMDYPNFGFKDPLKFFLKGA